ncbi:MAG: alpha/beta fold hydrolase [Phycisphaeraceae bacterium]|nr:alpha/beta fold hydrolase [Phycisphaeraceae bacterium]
MPTDDNPSKTVESPRRGGVARHLRRWWWAWWLALALLSHLPELFLSPPKPTGPSVTIPAMADDGPVSGRTTRIGFRQWMPPEESNRPAVLLIHGSPGRSADFERLGPLLAEAGWRTIAIDLPGFGQSDHWVPSYSVRAHARAAWAALDELGVRRAHVVGWSMGGGVALWMSEFARGRTASVTLMASIGAQETEGSGDYYFEHAKYALGYGVLVIGGELVPLPLHQNRWLIHSWIRNFWDTDQRPLHAILQAMRTPLLVLHGRHDPLSPAWGAEHNHALTSRARLVMLDESHFLPFIRPHIAAGELATFFGAVEGGTWESLPRVRDLAPEPARRGMSARIAGASRWLRDRHWAIEALTMLVLVGAARHLGLGVSGFLVAGQFVSLGVAAVGAIAGDLRRSPRRGVGPIALRALANWALLVVSSVLATFVVLPLWDGLGAIGWLAGIVVVAAALRIARGVWTAERRARLRASTSRIWRHEFWPTRALYLPVFPWLAWLAIRYRGPLVFTCANPGIENGGGVTGESKYGILRGFAAAAPESVPASFLIPAGGTPGDRASRVAALMAEHDAVREFPVILKPDSGEHGVEVRLARDEAEVLAYFGRVEPPVVLQAFAPGPREYGVLWVRDPAPGSGMTGRIFSIVRKEFPEIEGDGRRTLRRLILSHPRYRMQMDVFLRRMRDRLDRTPGKGERVSLGSTGNHVLGAIFHDGSELRTEALERAIDRIAAGFRGNGGGEFDFGRFDIRCPSQEEFRAGRSLSIIECNGTLSESTNLYDPHRPVWWAWGVLIRQWATVYRVGAKRRIAGARPMRVRDLLRAALDQRRRERAARR